MIHFSLLLQWIIIWLGIKYHVIILFLPYYAHFRFCVCVCECVCVCVCVCVEREGEHPYICSILLIHIYVHVYIYIAYCISMTMMPIRFFSYCSKINYTILNRLLPYFILQWQHEFISFYFINNSGSWKGILV